MKRFLLSLTVAALCGVSQATTISAEYADVVPKMKPGDAKFIEIQPKDAMNYFTSKDIDVKKIENPAWYYLRIPYELRGRSRDPEVTPSYVDELKVRVYLLFALGSGDYQKLMMVDKEVTYVNIPLPREGTGDDGKSQSENKAVNAGVFLSPADATRIWKEDERLRNGGKPKKGSSNKLSKVSLEKLLAAVAVEYGFKDKEDVTSKKELKKNKDYKDGFIVVPNTSLKEPLKKMWWKKENKNALGVQLCAISETPFAPFYAPTFPPTSPMYGSAYTGGSMSGAPSMGAPMDGYVPSSATEDSAAPAEAAVEEAPAPTKKSKKRRK